MTSRGGPTVPPDYVLGQLWRALETAATSAEVGTRQRAAAKADRWRAVLDGMASGDLAVGSRTPVGGVPAWVTLEVAHGGFATGRLLAEQPLDDDERAVLARLPAVPGATDRERLNRWYLSDAGQAELLASLTEDRYAVDLPEHAALPAVALLLDSGRPEAALAALDLVAELAPWLPRLRLTPRLRERPQPPSTLVHLQPVGAVAEALRATVPQPRVVAMTETLRVWTPLYDDLVALWADTVEGDLPHLVRQGTNTTVAGGWPCRRLPEDWPGRRAGWLERYARAAAGATTPTRHQHPRSTLTRLRRALEAAEDPSTLTGRDVGRVRRALADAVTRHGAPGSVQQVAVRARQAAVAALPTHARLAHVVAGRLDRYAADGGLPAVEPVVAATTDDDAPEAPGGHAVPASVVRKVRRALEAPVPDLVAQGVIGSGEVLAAVLPQVVASHVAAGLDSPVAASLYARTYQAFRRRRSLLLLHLQHQVGLDELPWVRALGAFRADGSAGRTASAGAVRQALREGVMLALAAFPQQVLPNPLVRELGALAGRADLRLALVEEVAADIFTGTFTTKWRTAAAVASAGLQGSLYARYYDLPDPSYWTEPPLQDLPGPGRLARLRRRWGRQTAEDFTALCRARAREAGVADRRGSVAANGAVLEQSQVLTTHNLAVLTVGLDLVPWLQEEAPDLASRTLAWVLRAHSRLPDEPYVALRGVKNLAYAWRQAVFYLSHCDEAERAAVAQRLLDETASGPAARLHPVAEGLAHVVGGGRFLPSGEADAGAGRRLLGWSVGEHWLLVPA